MKITADTNVLVRAVVQDDVDQARAAIGEMELAETIAVTLPTLCEFVWVLSRAYTFTRQDIVSAVEGLMAVAKVALDRPAAEAGLAVFKAGGDFADGAIRFDASRARCEHIVTFDQDFARLGDAGDVVLLGRPGHG